MTPSKRVLTRVLLLIVFVLDQGPAQEFEEKWITRPAYFRKFPSAVYISTSRSPDKFCTGTLLSPHWVLTAARCMLKETGNEVVENDTSLRVHAGVDDKAKLSSKNVQNRSSIHLTLHQKNVHSLALIKLNRAMDIILDVVEPATVTSSCFVDVEDSVCTSGSYGVHSQGMNYMQFDLRTCQCHDELKEKFPDELQDKWICGQYNTCLEICNGDYGMGLMCDGNLQAVGIGHAKVDEAEPCGIKSKQPTCDPIFKKGLYVDLCYHTDWLRVFIPSMERAVTHKLHSIATLISPTSKWSVCCMLFVLLLGL